MIPVLEIVTGIVLVVIVFVWAKRRQKPGSSGQASGSEPSKKPPKRMTDTRAFRQYAHGDIDHDTYREILEKNQKEGK